MIYLTALFSIGSLVCAVLAAFYWYASAYRDIPAPDYAKRLMENDIISFEGDLWVALQTSARLNRKGALWTAASVALSAAASLAGALSN